MLKEHQPTISETVSEEDASQKHYSICTFNMDSDFYLWQKSFSLFLLKKNDYFYDLFIKIEVKLWF